MFIRFTVISQKKMRGRAVGGARGADIQLEVDAGRNAPAGGGGLNFSLTAVLQRA